MDAFKYAADLLPNQSQLLQNVYLLDNGRAVTRPGADWLDAAGNASTRANINPAGEVQGLGFLDTFSGGASTQFLFMAQGGKSYKWNGTAWSNPLAWSPSSASTLVSTVQGVNALLICDGDTTSAMQLWDGTNFTSCGALADTNAPWGATVVSFIAGMFVAAGQGGMIQGGGNTQYPPDTLFFSNYLNGGAGQWNANQSFRVGNGDGEAIVGLCPVQTTASTYPIYNLAVLKENSVWIVGISPGSYPTTGGGQFANMFAAFASTPQGDQVGTGIGCVGRRAYCQYQNDLLFFSQEGVQSLQRMQAAAGQYQLTDPLSQPIQPFIDRINWSYAQYIQAVKYRQWAIFFVPLDGSTVNNYALVWDGKIQQWMIWTGWTPSAAIVTRFQSGTQYAGGSTQAGIQLVLGNSDGSITVWKDNQNILYQDATYLDNGAPIQNQTINTRSFVFGSLDFQKKLRACLVRFNQGNANVNLSAWLDTAEDDTWEANIAPGGAVLPVFLPFVLASNKPVQAYRSLLGLPYCSEFFVEITANGGWFDCRNVVASAYRKTVRDPNA